MRPYQTLVPLGLLLASVSIVAAGCAGSGGSPSVASLGATNGTTTSSSGSRSSGDAGTGSSPGSGGAVLTILVGGGNGLKFSQCMRAHGVANFPDPNGQGEIQLGPGSGIDPSSPTVQAARKACAKLTGGRTPNPAEQAKIRLQALAFSACMRKHGLPDFPDPTFPSSGQAIHLVQTPGGDLNPSSPTFQAAQRACHGTFPGGKLGSPVGGQPAGVGGK